MLYSSAVLGCLHFVFLLCRVIWPQILFVENDDLEPTSIGSSGEAAGSLDSSSGSKSGEGSAHGHPRVGDAGRVRAVFLEGAELEAAKIIAAKDRIGQGF